MLQKRLDKYREYVARATTAEAAAKCLEELAPLIAANPDDHDLALTHMLLREKTRIKKAMLEDWLAFHEKFPEDHAGQRYCARWLYRRHMLDEAREFIRNCYPQGPCPPKLAVHLAQLHEEIHDYEAAEELLRKVIAEHPEAPEPRVILAKSLKLRGRFKEAHEQLASFSGNELLPPSARELLEDLDNGIRVLDKVAPGVWRKTPNAQVAALYEAIRMFSDRRLPPARPDVLGPVTLLSGSLAAGGAERQMVNTTVNLIKARKAGREIGGVRLEGPFEILVTTLNAADRKDFYHQQALAGGAPVMQVQNIKPLDISQVCPDNPDLTALLPLLPPSPLYGVQRITGYFREKNTEVAYLWQDGAVLLAALAALIAGVKRVVINFRGLPPVVRRHLYREEYDHLYKALALVPGVSFASNGMAAARAYAEWLDIPLERFTIVPNGIKLPPARQDSEDIAAWEEFTRRTADATHTIGGVFRFETEKRPLLWVLFAREYLAHHPRARFVIAGDGRLFEAARERAREFGIADRILFVGQTTNIAFWLKKMDVLLLLSRYEGLPNVLIEAQMEGIPVVSTPAGSAEETFLEGETGFMIEELENPSAREISEKVGKAVELLRRDPDLPEKARRYATERFSIDSMLHNTVRLLTGTGQRQ